MKPTIIKSKGGSQFHPMVPVLLFLFCVPAFSSGSWVLLALLVLLMIVTLMLDKTVTIDVYARKVKLGLFSSWDDLSIGGYVSIFSETSGMKMQARVQSTSVKTKELKLNYIQGRTKKPIYMAKTFEDALNIAHTLSYAWDVGIYDAKSKEWVKEIGE